MKGEAKTKRGSTAKDSRRRHRPRPTPRWLKAQQDLDDTARRRTLLVLQVLSGETPVTDAIAQAQVSRGLYYQLEERALRAMLRALTPGAQPQPDGEVGSGADGYLKRIGELEARLKVLETEKRRAERLLLLTRKVVPKGSVSSGRGRPPKSQMTSPSRTTSPSTTTARQPSRSSSTSSGAKPSTPSPRTMPRTASSPLPATSVPMPPGARAL
ncbi:MAG TPA: hypothetical protein VFO83_03345 [Aggregicoccus sp.]|nr:hypothetical protein [Aggregicoccus sp.]